MSLFSLGQRTSSAVIGAAWEIRAGTFTDVHIAEVCITQATAGAVMLGWGKPQVVGLLPTTAQSFLPEDDVNALSQTVACVAWGTAPQTPLTGNFVRRCTMASAIGTGIIWTFPGGYEMDRNTSAVLWATVVPPTFDVWAVIWE